MIESESVVKLLWEHDPAVLNELREMEAAVEEAGMNNYPNLDRDWVWVAEENGKIVASLFAAPAHGVAILLRLCSKANNPATVRTLLRQALKSMNDRGYSMFFSFLDATKTTELKLAKIAQRYGCQLIPFSGLIVAGKIKQD